MKLADISIKRPVFATVMVGALVVFGLVAYPRVGVDLNPDVEFPVVTVTAIYPGADPETVESKVVDKLEEAINTVTGIKVLQSTSTENVGLVVVEFELERKADQALQDVRDKVSGILGELPSDLEPPVVQKFDIGSIPIVALSLSGEKDVRELTRIADKVVKEQLQTLRGVGEITIVGGQEREFHVYVDPSRLESYGLAVTDVMQMLAAQNVEIPGGRLDLGQREFAVKTRGQVHSAEEIGRIILTAAEGATVRVSDVARVVDGEQERRSYSSVNGKAAVALIVRKQSGSNTVEVAHAVKKKVEELKPRLPSGVGISTPTDNSIFIEDSIKDTQFDLLFGAVLAVLVILFFLHDWRATLISALALPTSVIATVAFIQAMGFTFNTMTMLALSLSIGILIDDAIVVIENIHRHLEEGKPPLRAAAEATREIGLAVLATTASIVAVFVPVATMKGIIGRFFLQFGLTVAFAVSVSLFVAFTLTPMLSARLLRRKAESKPGRLAQRIEGWLHGIDGGYRRVLGAALRHRAWTLVFALVVFCSTLGLSRVLRTEFFPEEDRGQFNVTLETPVGTALGVTEKLAEAVATDIRRLPGVTDTFVTVGGNAQSEVQSGTIQVNLVPRKARAFSQTEAMNHVRALLASRGGAKFAVEPINEMGGGGWRSSMIQFNIRGKDYGELNRAAEQLMQAMRQKGGFVDLDTSYRGGKPEVAINIDRDRAADLGVPVASVALAIRTLIAGEKATEVATDGERFDVRLRLDEAFRHSREDLLKLRVRSTNPGPMGAPPELVHLANLVSLEDSAGPAKIERQNRQRQVTVYANLEGKALGQAVQEVEAVAKTLPRHLDTGWSGFGDIMKESFGHLVAALILAIIMVYLVLAAQFESFVHPFTIMLSLPLSFVGAVGALVLCGHTLNVVSAIGFILLMGLVTKNAILLVDYTNTLRARGLSKTEALLAAGPVRLRPILMTTAAMIFGMVPVALGMSQGSEIRAPMAVAVIGGLVTSTLLTLVVVPVVYSLLDGLAERVRGKRASAVPSVELEPTILEASRDAEQALVQGATVAVKPVRAEVEAPL